MDALRTIVGNTSEIEKHTTALADIARFLEGVKADTEALPPLREDMARVAEATSVLKGMDRRITTIEEAMPVLVKVQKHLDRLPETMERLDDRIERLSGLMENLLTALEALNTSVDTLHGGMQPMARLASRVPGQRKG
jgi:predicted  nucleic acid-binding Zn-ribbon protein